MAFRKSVFQTFRLVRAHSSPSGTFLRSLATGSPPSNDSNEDHAKSNGDTKDQKKNKRSHAALELLQELLREPTPGPENNIGGAGPAVMMNKHHHNKFNQHHPAMSNNNEKLDIVDGVKHSPLTVEEKSTWPWKDQLAAESDCKDVEMDEAGSLTSFSSSSAFNARSGAAAPVYDDHADDHNDPFNKFQPGDFCPPEDLNWYNTENDEERKKTRYVVKPAKLFQRANQDPLELALNPDLLRNFLSPTGRIQPKRFTGLSAKEQRQMKRAVKLSRNLALLPFLSQYPRPSLEQRNELLGHRGSDDFQLYSQGLNSEDQEEKEEKHRLKTSRNRSSSSSFDARGYEMQEVEPSKEDFYKIDLDLEGLDDEFKKRK